MRLPGSESINAQNFCLLFLLEQFVWPFRQCVKPHERFRPISAALNVNFYFF